MTGLKSCESGVDDVDDEFVVIEFEFEEGLS
jgi:hypothetical protein